MPARKSVFIFSKWASINDVREATVDEFFPIINCGRILALWLHEECISNDDNRKKYQKFRDNEGYKAKTSKANLLGAFLSQNWADNTNQTNRSSQPVDYPKDPEVKLSAQMKNDRLHNANEAIEFLKDACKQLRTDHNWDNKTPQEILNYAISKFDKMNNKTHPNYNKINKRISLDRNHVNLAAFYEFRKLFESKERSERVSCAGNPTIISSKEIQIGRNLQQNNVSELISKIQKRSLDKSALKLELLSRSIADCIISDNNSYSTQTTEYRRLIELYEKHNPKLLSESIKKNDLLNCDSFANFLNETYCSTITVWPEGEFRFNILLPSSHVATCLMFEQISKELQSDDKVNISLNLEYASAFSEDFMCVERFFSTSKYDFIVSGFQPLAYAMKNGWLQGKNGYCIFLMLPPNKARFVTPDVEEQNFGIQVNGTNKVLFKNDQVNGNLNIPLEKKFVENFDSISIKRENIPNNSPLIILDDKLKSPRALYGFERSLSDLIHAVLPEIHVRSDVLLYKSMNLEFSSPNVLLCKTRFFEDKNQLSAVKYVANLLFNTSVSLEQYNSSEMYSKVNETLAASAKSFNSSNFYSLNLGYSGISEIIELFVDRIPFF